MFSTNTDRITVRADNSSEKPVPTFGACLAINDAKFGLGADGELMAIPHKVTTRWTSDGQLEILTGLKYVPEEYVQVLVEGKDAKAGGRAAKSRAKRKMSGRHCLSSAGLEVFRAAANIGCCATPGSDINLVCKQNLLVYLVGQEAYHAVQGELLGESRADLMTNGPYGETKEGKLQLQALMDQESKAAQGALPDEAEAEDNEGPMEVCEQNLGELQRHRHSLEHYELMLSYSEIPACIHHVIGALNRHLPFHTRLFRQWTRNSLEWKKFVFRTGLVLMHLGVHHKSLVSALSKRSIKDADETDISFSSARAANLESAIFDQIAAKDEQLAEANDLLHANNAEIADLRKVLHGQEQDMEAMEKLHQVALSSKNRELARMSKFHEQMLASKDAKIKECRNANERIINAEIAARQRTHQTLLNCKDVEIKSLQKDHEITLKLKDHEIAELREAYERNLLVKDGQMALLQKANECDLATKDRDIAALSKSNEAALAAKDREIAALQKANEAALAAKDRDIAALSKSNEAALAAKDREIAALSKSNEAALAAKDREIAALSKSNEDALVAKDREIAALQRNYEVKIVALQKANETALAAKDGEIATIRDGNKTILDAKDRLLANAQKVNEKFLAAKDHEFKLASDLHNQQMGARLKEVYSARADKEQALHEYKRTHENKAAFRALEIKLMGRQHAQEIKELRQEHQCNLAEKDEIIKKLQDRQKRYDEEITTNERLQKAKDNEIAAVEDELKQAQTELAKLRGVSKKRIQTSEAVEGCPDTVKRQRRYRHFHHERPETS